MRYTITKTFKLDMGHRTWSQDMRSGRGHEYYSTDLKYPYNKCANIHGHSLLISVSLGADSLDHQSFIMDTDLFKVPFQKIIDQMDHAFIIDQNDPLFQDFKNIADKNNLRLYIVDFSPSFEALAEYFYNQMEQIVADTPSASGIIVLDSVVTGEHMTVSATYKK